MISRRSASWRITWYCWRRAGIGPGLAAGSVQPAGHATVPRRAGCRHRPGHHRPARPDFGLTELDVEGETLFVSHLPQAPGQQRRVRIPARDVSVCRQRPETAAYSISCPSRSARWRRRRCARSAAPGPGLAIPAGAYHTQIGVGTAAAGWRPTVRPDQKRRTADGGGRPAMSTTPTTA